jgi:serine protease SohB
MFPVSYEGHFAIATHSSSHSSSPYPLPYQEAKAKFQEQLEDIHTAFAGHVETNRGQLSAAEVATGEAWLACQAVEKVLRVQCSCRVLCSYTVLVQGLVDDLMTSDEYLRSKMERYEVIGTMRDHCTRCTTHSLPSCTILHSLA